MSRIKLNLRKLSTTEKIAKAKSIVVALSGNSNFTTPSPSLATVTTAILAFESANGATLAARQAVKSSTSDQAVKEDELIRLLNQLAGYVESVAGNSDTLIQNAGMDTKSARSVVGLPNHPTGLSAVAGVHDGEVDLSWDKVASARSYLIEKCSDPMTAAGWSHAGTSTRAQIQVNGLASGSRFWFRVAAVGTFGQSGWSDPAARLVP